MEKDSEDGAISLALGLRQDWRQQRVSRGNRMSGLIRVM